MNKLSRIGRYDLAGGIIKKYKLSLQKYENIQLSLIENSARSMPNWEKEKFCWDTLEEVYMKYPSAIAACIKKLVKDKKLWRENSHGVYFHSLSLPLSFTESQKSQSIYPATSRIN